ncbi:MAG: tetratricopeptide repeat protein [Myxococcales bacterium]|nr:tetratricopeptide repeat protein [Myxococcales bacterium]
MRYTSLFGWAFFAVSLWSAPVQAVSLHSIFADANAAYQHEDYRRAIKNYSHLVRLGVHDPDVYFNLAIAHAKLENYGNAIRYFERALRLRPSDATVQKNLKQADQALAARHLALGIESAIQHEPPFVPSVLRRVSVSLLFTLVAVFNFLCFAFLTARVLLRKETWRLVAGVGSGVTGVGLFLAGFLLLAKTGIVAASEDAVVLLDRARIQVQPRADGTEKGHAFEGERALILKRHGTYYRVTFADGRKGWILTDAIGII